MSTLPDHDPGEFPEGFRDPVADPDLPFVVAYDDADPDPVPPADRLAAEPSQVEAEV